MVSARVSVRANPSALAAGQRAPRGRGARHSSQPSARSTGSLDGKRYGAGERDALSLWPHAHVRAQTGELSRLPVVVAGEYRACES